MRFGRGVDGLFVLAFCFFCLGFSFFARGFGFGLVFCVGLIRGAWGGLIGLVELEDLVKELEDARSTHGLRANGEEGRDCRKETKTEWKESDQYNQ
jgi:hypothetical protein